MHSLVSIFQGSYGYIATFSMACTCDGADNSLFISNHSTVLGQGILYQKCLFQACAGQDLDLAIQSEAEYM